MLDGLTWASERGRLVVLCSCGVRVFDTSLWKPTADVSLMGLGFTLSEQRKGEPRGTEQREVRTNPMWFLAIES